MQLSTDAQAFEQGKAAANLDEAAMIHDHIDVGGYRVSERGTAMIHLVVCLVMQRHVFPSAGITSRVYYDGTR